MREELDRTVEAILAAIDRAERLRVIPGHG